MATKKEVKKERSNGEKTVRDSNGRFVAGNTCGGRKKVPEEVKEACRCASMEAVEVVLAIMRDKSEKARDRLSAANSILDRAYGKPFQAVAIEDSTDHSITIKWESEEYGA